MKYVLVDKLDNINSNQFVTPPQKNAQFFNKNNELTVLRASGFSIWMLIFPAILNTILISILYLFVFNS